MTKIREDELSNILHSDAGSAIKDIMSFSEINNVSIIDSAIHYSTTKGIEIESVASMIMKSPKAMEKITEEAESLKFIPVTARLPITLD